MGRAGEALLTGAILTCLVGEVGGLLDLRGLILTALVLVGV